MHKKSVLCIAISPAQADQIVEMLKAAGFSNNDISALFPNRANSRDFAYEKGAKVPQGAATGAATGTVLGGAFGWLAGIGALAIPGVGPLVAAGPIAGALGGAALGGAAGGIAGALIGLGIPEYEARRYEGKVRLGGILISVHTENSAEIRRAKEIFAEAEAQDITVAGEVYKPATRKSKPAKPVLHEEVHH